MKFTATFKPLGLDGMQWDPMGYAHGIPYLALGTHGPLGPAAHGTHGLGAPDAPFSWTDDQ